MVYLGTNAESGSLVVQQLKFSDGTSLTTGAGGGSVSLASTVTTGIVKLSPDVTLASSDSQTVPTVAAVKSYVTTVTSGLGGGGSTTVVDNLTSSSTSSALSANQGRILSSILSTPASVSSVGMVQLSDLAVNTAPTSTSTSLAPTINALTNTYNKLSTQISGISGGGTVVNAASYSGSTSDTSSPSVLAVQNAISGISSSGTTSVATNFGSASTVNTAVSVGNQANTPSVSVQGLSINLLNPVATSSASVNIANNATATGSVNIAVSSASPVNIGNSSTTLALKGTTWNLPVDLYPPTSTATTDTASINCVKQVYNLANLALPVANLIDLYPPTSTSTTTAATVNCVKQVYNLANLALPTANLLDLYPPTSSSTTTAATVNCVRQVYQKAITAASTTQAGSID